ncbi:MAG: hypothetical protein K0S25_613 [Bacillus sp. (in: firmicutes)]|nr:hypothetical protein [Bacillus sp. (in: firmicutes)]
MNVGSMSNNMLIYKTLLNTLSLEKADSLNSSKITNNNTFQTLLEQALLQAQMTNESANMPDDSSSLLDGFDLTSLGLQSTSFEAIVSSLGLNTSSLTSSLGLDLSSLDTTSSSLGTGNLDIKGTNLQYRDVDTTTLNSHLKGALKNAGPIFAEAGKKYQINPAFLAAISMHETGNGTSNAVRFKNNVAGMMGKGGLKLYSSIQDSIFDMARNLKNNYLDEGKTTIAQIGAKYAPVGAKNDPLQLNNHWVNGVQSYFDTISNKTDFS